jgi:hypothetical protein
LTTIAATKSQIAGDRQANHSGGLKFKLKTKVHAFDNNLFYKTPFYVGLCGNLDQFAGVLGYFSDPSSYKKIPRMKKGEGLILSADGKIWTFTDPTTWLLVDQPYYAIGSGMNFAMGSMAAGSTAYEAVKYAATLCPNTGMGITKIDI